MKKKLTISEQLNQRKYHTPKRIVTFAYKKLSVFLTYNFNMHIKIIDDVNKCDGPCFVIFNHLSRLDHLYIMNATYPRRTNMLAGNSEFFRKKFSTVFRWNNVIPKKQYSLDRLYIKAFSRIIKNGGCITFAPEGLASDYGGNKPIVPGTSKLFKHFGVPVYFCHLEGQYLQNTKVCLDQRKGATYATMSLLFSKDDVKNLSVEEMDDIINTKFRRNEYAWTKEKHIKWHTHGRICYRLEDYLFKCPKCGKEFTMKGEGNKIECSACGNGATMDDYYQFHPYEGAVIPEDPYQWVEKERYDIIREIRSDPNYRFEDDCKLGLLDEYKLVPGKTATSFIVGEGKVWIDHTGLHYQGTCKGQPHHFDVGYSTLYTLITEVDSSYFNFYMNGEYVDIFPKHQTVGKFTLLVEEMHRYHINYYKNFKWNDYLYEGQELGIDLKKPDEENSEK